MHEFSFLDQPPKLQQKSAERLYYENLVSQRKCIIKRNQPIQYTYFYDAEKFDFMEMFLTIGEGKDPAFQQAEKEDEEEIRGANDNMDMDIDFSLEGKNKQNLEQGQEQDEQDVEKMRNFDNILGHLQSEKEELSISKPINNEDSQPSNISSIKPEKNEKVQIELEDNSNSFLKNEQSDVQNRLRAENTLRIQSSAISNLGELEVTNEEYYLEKENEQFEEQDLDRQIEQSFEGNQPQLQDILNEMDERDELRAKEQKIEEMKQLPLQNLMISVLNSSNCAKFTIVSIINAFGKTQLRKQIKESQKEYIKLDKQALNIKLNRPVKQHCLGQSKTLVKPNIVTAVCLNCKNKKNLAFPKFDEVFTTLCGKCHQDISAQYEVRLKGI